MSDKQRAPGTFISGSGIRESFTQRVAFEMSFDGEVETHQEGKKA